LAEMNILSPNQSKPMSMHLNKNHIRPLHKSYPD